MKNSGSRSRPGCKEPRSSPDAPPAGRTPTVTIQVPKPRKFPARVAEILRRHAEGFDPESCPACPSRCCDRGGFAILENVLMAYGLYSQGMLSRRGFAFARGLSFIEFVRRHFDVWVRRAGPAGRETEFAAFHARSVSPTGRAIEIPAGGDYWDDREMLFAANPGLNRGCVFLSDLLPPEGKTDRKSRSCILHSPRSLTHLTAKPIDCVYYNCANPGPGRLPTLEEKDEWFLALAESSPGSARTFEIGVFGG